MSLHIPHREAVNVPDPFNVCAQIKSSDLDASWGSRSFPQTWTVPWGVGCPGPKGRQTSEKGLVWFQTPQ